MPTSPSNLERRVLCPGSEREEAGAPKGKSSEAAERGTLLHKVMRDLVETGVSDVLTRGELSTEDREAVESAWECAAPMLAQAKKENATILTEEQLDLAFLGMNVEEDPDRCRADLIILHADSATLLDWKFGRAYTPRPLYNWQLKAYAVGVWRAYGAQSVYVGRIQPALGEAAVAMDRFDSSQLAEFEKEIKVAMVLTKDSGAELVPGERQCHFCNAKTTCPARTGSVMGVPRGMNVIEFMKRCDPALRAETFNTILMAAEWLADVIGEVEVEILSDSLMIPGFEAGNGRGNRAWADEGGAFVALRDLGLTDDQAMPRKLISPAQAEELLGKRKAVKDKLGPLQQTTLGKPKVVRTKTG